MKKFTILHTSDWHIGHQLYRFRRDEEFRNFFDWLLRILAERQVDALLVAGDVFDTAAPSASAQKLYYDFLAQAVKSGCRHIVITAGNHDSPVFLTAPHELLRNFDIHVIGSADAADSLILHNAAGKPACLVSALPYLRERDLRCDEVVDGDLLPGLRKRYQEAADSVDRLRRAHGDLPAVAMGHIFVAGVSMDNEGERIVQVGNLDRAPRDIFPQTFDYVALGHIHRPQAVSGDEHCRYSGSPLPMSFAESAQHKSVVLLTFAGREPHVELLSVPQSRHLVRLTGNREQLLADLRQLLATGEAAFVEMQHDGTDAVGDLNSEARQLAEGSGVSILCIKTQPSEENRIAENPARDLADYTKEDVFRLLLDTRDYPEEKRSRLLETFCQLCASYEESLRGGE